VLRVEEIGLTLPSQRIFDLERKLKELCRLFKKIRSGEVIGWISKGKGRKGFRELTSLKVAVISSSGIPWLLRYCAAEE